VREADPGPGNGSRQWLAAMARGNGSEGNGDKFRRRMDGSMIGDKVSWLTTPSQTRGNTQIPVCYA
jgi:hypothetical protein